MTNGIQSHPSSDHTERAKFAAMMLPHFEELRGLTKKLTAAVAAYSSTIPATTDSIDARKPLSPIVVVGPVDAVHSDTGAFFPENVLAVSVPDGTSTLPKLQSLPPFPRLHGLLVDAVAAPVSCNPPTAMALNALLAEIQEGTRMLPPPPNPGLGSGLFSDHAVHDPGGLRPPMLPRSAPRPPPSSRPTRTVAPSHSVSAAFTSSTTTSEICSAANQSSASAAWSSCSTSSLVPYSSACASNCHASTCLCPTLTAGSAAVNSSATFLLQLHEDNNLQLTVAHHFTMEEQVFCARNWGSLSPRRCLSSRLQHLSRTTSNCLPPPPPQPPPLPLPPPPAATGHATELHAVAYGRQVFDRVPHPWNDLWYNTLLHGYECSGEVLVLFQEIQAKGLETPVTLVSVLSACALLRALEQTGDLQCAWKVFDRIPSWNVISWTAMLSGYIQNGFAGEALLMFNDTRQENVYPSEYTSASSLVHIRKERDCIEQPSTDIWHAVGAVVQSACSLANVAPEAVTTCSLVADDADGSPVSVSSSGDTRTNITVLRMRPTVASKKFGQEDILCPLIADACTQVCPQNSVNFNDDNVTVANMLGGGLHNSCVVRGIVLQNDATGSIKRVEMAEIAVSVGGVDTSATEAKETVVIHPAEQLENYAANGTAITAARTRKDEAIFSEIQSQLKKANVIVDVKATSNSNVLTTSTVQDPFPYQNYAKAERQYLHHHAERVSWKCEALEVFENANQNMHMKDSGLISSLNLENAEKTKLDEAAFYGKKLLKLEDGSELRSWLYEGKITEAHIIPSSKKIQILKLVLDTLVGALAKNDKTIGIALELLEETEGSLVQHCVKREKWKMQKVRV